MKFSFTRLALGLVMFLGAAAGFAASKKGPDTPPRVQDSVDVSPKPGVKTSEEVWVARNDGGKSCGEKAPQTEEEAATELKQAGVRVLGSGKGRDGKLHAQMCGMPTGDTLRFRIPAGDVPKALALGFQAEPAK